METLELNNDELKALGKKLGAGVKTEEELVNLTKTLAIGDDRSSPWCRDDGAPGLRETLH